MLQIKKFTEKSSLKSVNNFLATHNNCVILNYNPFIIQYEVLENTISPTTLEGPPVYVYINLANEFEESEHEIKFNCSQLLIFDSYILLRKGLDMWLKLDYRNHIKLSTYYSDRGLETFFKGNVAVKDINIGEYSANEFDKFSRFSLKDLLKSLTSEGMAYVDPKLNYQVRTNTLIQAAHISGNYKKESSKIIKKGLDNVSNSIVIGSIIQSNTAKRIHNADLGNRYIR